MSGLVEADRLWLPGWTGLTGHAAHLEELAGLAPWDSASAADFAHASEELQAGQNEVVVVWVKPGPEVIEVKEFAPGRWEHVVVAAAWEQCSSGVWY